MVAFKNQLTLFFSPWEKFEINFKLLIFLTCGAA